MRRFLLVASFILFALTLLVSSFVASSHLVLANASWALTTPMNSVHWHTSMTTLQDGRVMVVSGGGVPFVNVTELYDPVTETWALTGNVNQQRDQFNPVTLNNGKVLIAGGQTTFGSGPTASSELYDPTTGTWSFTGSHVNARQVAIYIKLLDGRVLAIGGLYSLTSEIYDPNTGQWSLSGNLNHQRSGTERNAVILNDGKVLVFGANSPTNTTEIFDPATNTWTPTGNTNVARVDGMVIKLQDGRVLLFNGSNGSYLKDAEIYDPVTGVWTPIPSLNYGRSLPNAVLLPDGRVFVSGGRDAAGAVKQSEIYDPNTNSWTVDATMNIGHHAGQMAMLSTGKILIAGGFDFDLVNEPFNQTRSAELYTWESIPTPTPTATPTPTPEPEFSSITYDDRTKSVIFDTNHDCGGREIAMWVAKDLNDYSNASRIWRGFFANNDMPFSTGALYYTYQITGNDPEPNTIYQVWMACGNTPEEAAVNGDFYHSTVLYDPSPLTINIPETVAVGATVNASANFIDPETPTTDYHVAWDWGVPGISQITGSYTGSNGTITALGSYIYTQPGVYKVRVYVDTLDGPVWELPRPNGSVWYGQYKYIVVYDANTSFAGGRSFENPVTANLSTPGKVTFGISSKYSSNTLTGNFKMNFKAADLDFVSTSMQSLATWNGRAYLTGQGQLNNVGGYSFLVTGIDGSVVGGDDYIRIQIKDVLNATVYDSQSGGSATADPITPVATGNVRIH